MKCVPNKGGRCATHGGAMVNGRCQTDLVLDEVGRERANQFARYGTNEGLEDGTGPRSLWLLPFVAFPAGVAEKSFRENYEHYKNRKGAPTWMHLVREEVAEAFQESDPARLRAELLQVAALCVSWVEKLDGRR